MRFLHLAAEAHALRVLTDAENEHKLQDGTEGDV